MRIDRNARRWIGWSVGLFAVATIAYVFDWRETGGHPNGGNRAGLAFGIAGFLAMLTAMLLAARKKMRSRLLGRTYYWMQAHIWIGFLSYPLILYHAGGFAWGGTLTQILMWIFTIVFVSGIFGLVMQQIIPMKLMRDVPAETIADQIQQVLQALRGEAAQIARTARASMESDPQEYVSPRDGAVAIRSSPAAHLAAFDSFYETKIVRFLADRFDARSPLASQVPAQNEFSRWRGRLDEAMRPAASQLESLVDERRQLAHQHRLHAWLHRWLLIHIPLSYGLMVLAAIHSVVALRYANFGR
jgi:hypothetical protein